MKLEHVAFVGVLFAPFVWAMVARDGWRMTLGFLAFVAGVVLWLGVLVWLVKIG